MSGICAVTRTSICTSDLECPSGFECLPAGSVSGCFPTSEPPPPDMGGGGGGCGVAGAPRGGAGLLLLLGLAGLFLRRRR